jgi:hypothetical protein
MIGKWTGKWEYTGYGWYVVEHDDQLKTGPFHTKEDAVKWFDRELDIQIPMEIPMEVNENDAIGLESE